MLLLSRLSDSSEKKNIAPGPQGHTMEQDDLCPVNTGDKLPCFVPTPEASGEKKKKATIKNF